jgi:hypothetical protein
MCISSLGGRVSEGSVLVNLLDPSDRAMVQGPCAAGTGDWELSVEVPARGTAPNGAAQWGLKVYGVQ